ASNASVAIAPAASSVTTTIIDNNTETFSLTQASTSVNEGAADTYTVHLSNPIDTGVTTSVKIGITLPGLIGGADSQGFSHTFLSYITAAVATTTGVSLNSSTSTLTFDSTFDTTAGFTFTLPTATDNLVEGNESYSVSLSSATTNASNASVAIAPAASSVTTTIIDNNTETFSLTQAST